MDISPGTPITLIASTAAIDLGPDATGRGVRVWRVVTDHWLERVDVDSNGRAFLPPGTHEIIIEDPQRGFARRAVDTARAESPITFDFVPAGRLEMGESSSSDGWTWTVRSSDSGITVRYHRSEYGFPAWLPPGRYQLSGEGPDGARTERVVEIRAGETTTVHRE
ncbi:MAG: hypothetical protein KDC38_14360 [Planctomycetes bacterium]|nr:hypothetical protein [Planctomycetota bacterium]